MGLRHASITKMLTPAYETLVFAYAKQPYDTALAKQMKGCFGPCSFGMGLRRNLIIHRVLHEKHQEPQTSCVIAP